MGAGKAAALALAVLAVALWIVFGDDASSPRGDLPSVTSDSPTVEPAPALPAGTSSAFPERSGAAVPTSQPEQLASATQEFPRAFLIVEVVSRVDGAPVPDAQVSVSPTRRGRAGAPPPERGTADRDGRWESAPSLGSLQLTAHLPGAWFGTSRYDHHDGEHETVAVARLEVWPLTEIRGRVTDPAGAPLEGVSVGNLVSQIAELDAVFTDADGRFAFRDAWVGRGNGLRFERPGYGSEVASVLTEPDGTWVVRNGATRSVDPIEGALLEVVLSPERVIVGRVVDFEGRGLAGIDVLASGMVSRGSSDRADERRAQTDAHGAFELRGTRIEAGYLVRADVPDLGVAMHYASPGEQRVDVGELRLAGFVTLSGRFVDASGRPAPGPWLDLHLTGLAEFDEALREVQFTREPARRLALAPPDLDGRFELTVPRLAALDLTVRLGSRVVQRHAPDLSRGALDMGDLRIDREASWVEGRLLDVDGAPLEGRRIQVGRSPGVPLAELRTDAEGAFRTWVLLPDASRIHLELMAWPGWPGARWKLTPDEIPVTLTARRAGEVR